MIFVENICWKALIVQCSIHQFFIFLCYHNKKNYFFDYFFSYYFLIIFLIKKIIKKSFNQNVTATNSLIFFVFGLTNSLIFELYIFTTYWSNLKNIDPTSIVISFFESVHQLFFLFNMCIKIIRHNQQQDFDGEVFCIC